MCGFVFAFDFEQHKRVNTNVVKNMISELNHRGPDDEGIAIVDNDFNCLKFLDSSADILTSNIIFGHKRLSIQDLSSKGRQPMVSDDNNYAIIFNGEIYNFPEIREELENLGHVFTSSSDTEVILKSFKEFGKDCVKKFNGMWAFIIYDFQRKKLFFSRDRFGKKPLYFTKYDGIIYFSSEANSFKHIPNFKFEPDLDYIKNYIKKGCSEWKKNTPFKNIYRFDISSNSEIDVKNFNGNIVCEKYWELAVNKSYENFHEGKAKNYAEKYYELLYDAVRIRLRSDVEVGSALSGGLDSASIVYLINQILSDQKKQHQQATFSTVYNSPDVKYCDETPFIDKVVSNLNVKSHFITPNVNDIVDEHMKAIKSMEFLFDGTAMSGWHTYKLTKSKNIKVTIDGQGADEQLGGYLHYFHSYIGSSSIFTIFNKMYYCLKIPGSKNFVLRGFILKILSIIIGKKNTESLLKKFGINFTFNLNETLAIQFQQSLVNLLYNADRQSMAHSVESRLPFMDYRLVEFLFSVPACYKIHNGWTKYIARIAFDNKLPNEVCWRKDKMGWPVPEEVWFSGDLNKWFNKELKNNSNFLSKVGISKNELSYNKKSNKIKVRLLNLSRWYDYFLKK